MEVLVNWTIDQILFLSKLLAVVFTRIIELIKQRTIIDWTNVNSIYQRNEKISKEIFLHFGFMSFVTILYYAFFFRERNQSSHWGHNTTDVFSTSAAVKYYISETY